MLFTVSLQLTKTGHLSTSPSSISLARMLSGLCLLCSSPPLDWLLFTLSPLCCPPLPPSSYSYHSYSAISGSAPPILSLPSSLSISYALPLPYSLSLSLKQFFCSLSHTSSLPLPAPSLFHILHLLAPHHRPPSYPSLTLSDSNWGSLIQTEVMMAIMYLAFQLRSLD